MAVHTTETDTRVEYLIVSDRRSDGVTIVHESPFTTLEDAADRLAWNYRWQENNMRVESRTVTTSPRQPIPAFQQALDAALARRQTVFAERVMQPDLNGVSNG